MGLWIERQFGFARVEFRHVGAPERSDVLQREFADYTLTVGELTHRRSRLGRRGLCLSRVCVFRTDSGADSGRTWALIPE
jgi:hypothetical protein